MISLIKMSLRVLLRNKGFLFFLLVTPALSAFILSIQLEQENLGKQGDESIPAIVELEDATRNAVYLGDTSAFIVKVYDASKSDLSEYVLETMAANGMFSVCRCDVSNMTEKEVLEQAKGDAFNDRAGILFYIKEDFEQSVLADDYEQALQLYIVSDDERQELFETELKDLLNKIANAKVLVGEDVGAILEMLDSITEKMPEKKIVSLAGKDSIQLTERQMNQKSQIGYAFAFITLGFLFCGVFVAHTVIEEQNNKVFTRVMLSKTSSRDYFVSKFVVSLAICILQTLVLAVCLSLVRGLDVGMSILSLLLVIFLLGLIFNTVSLVLGVLIGDVMSSNYAVFAIWSISALLAGLYFPLDDTTAALKTLSYLMPQRWFMDISELLLIGDNTAYSMLLCVTVAYLIVVISVGSVGLKMKRQEA